MEPDFRNTSFIFGDCCYLTSESFVPIRGKYLICQWERRRVQTGILIQIGHKWYNLSRRYNLGYRDRLQKRFLTKMVIFIGNFYICKLGFTQALRVLPALSNFSITVKFWEPGSGSLGKPSVQECKVSYPGQMILISLKKTKDAASIAPKGKPGNTERNTGHSLVFSDSGLIPRFEFLCRWSMCYEE